MIFPFYQVDAFTSRVFAGNPAVVVCLDAWREDAVLQSIAAEHSVSTTAFLVESEGNFEIRYFLPIGELPRGGVAAVTPAALAGEFGIVHGRLPYAQPWFDDLGRAAVYPIYYVVAGMAAAAGQTLIESTSSDRTRIACFAHAASDGGTRLWLANLSDRPQKVTLAAPRERPAGRTSRRNHIQKSGHRSDLSVIANQTA